MQPSDAEGAVDLNTIIPSLVESVEIITGGASAVYGSDAVAGVVNFKLKQIEGVNIDVQYGASDRGDANSGEVSLAFGHQFDRGTATFALNHMERDIVFGSDRPFFVNKTVGAAIIGGTAGGVPGALVATPPAFAALPGPKATPARRNSRTASEVQGMFAPSATAITPD